MLERRRTNSGAEIVELGDYVIKLNDRNADVRRRLNAQSAWLTTYDSIITPNVHVVWDGGYVMSRYDDGWPWDREVSVSLLTDWLLNVMPTHVWKHPPNHRGEDFFPLSLKWVDVHKRLPKDIADDAYELATNVRWAATPRCLTHGDPTFANMMRRGLMFVLSDPIPASNMVPDVRAVDLGKMLQSILGWETIAHGWSVCDQDDALKLMREFVKDEDEWHAAIFCCVLHVARLIPYYPKHAEEAVEVIARAALRL